MSSIVHYIHSFKWSDIASVVGKIIPPLQSNSFKGQMGRVGVIGGSEHYSGAPYYCAQTALNFGGDLAFVFCSKSSSFSIKSYSPELMVVPFYNDDAIFNSEQFSDIISRSWHRFDTLVIGPGLGRSEFVVDYVSKILVEAVKRNVPLVIDADGLWVINQNPLLIKGYIRCVLTPNHAEFGRLITALQSRIGDSLDAEYLARELASGVIWRQVRAASQALGGVTVVCKGAEDVISAGDDVYILNEQGSPRRCGGQGDILSGSLAVALTWALKREEHLSPLTHLVGDCPQIQSVAVNGVDGARVISPSTTSKAVLYSTFLACSVNRRAGVLAFAQKARSMGAPDVMANIGNAFVELWPEG